MKPAWLSDAVIYQIYPQSFQDSNGDGIGDFNGLASRLDYLKDLGINVIWLNPCFDSPFGDAGYDVRDFMKIAPRYGTNDDLAALCEKASEKGIRIILDLVAGHTSIEHPWFVESAKGPDNEYSDRYIWMNRDFDPEKGPTNENFRSNFFWYQPALNFGFANPKEDWQDPVDAPGPMRNRQAMKDIMAYWMDRGAAGFRVDMASSLVKEDEGFVETTKLWNEWRAWLEEKYPDNILVAEWSNPAQAIPAGFHLDFMMHFNCDVYKSLFFNGDGTLPYAGGDCYFDANGKGTPWIFMDEYKKQLEAVSGKGYISMPTANHDFQRPRCGKRGWEGLKPIWAFLMTQAGPPTIYYGDEIGMRFSEDAPAKEGSTLIGVTAPNAGDTTDGERAGTRTPMQWDDTANAGFSTVAESELYLPLDPDPNRPTVAAQEEAKNSFLNFVKKILTIRKENPALGADGEYRFLNPKNIDYPMIYERKFNGQCCVVFINPTKMEKELTIDYSAKEAKELIQENTLITLDDSNMTINLKPFSFGIFEMVK